MGNEKGERGKGKTKRGSDRAVGVDALEEHGAEGGAVAVGHIAGCLELRRHRGHHLRVGVYGSTTLQTCEAVPRRARI